MRWTVEVMNHGSKQHLGFEEPQGWTRQSVERTVPMAMLLYSLVVLWFAQHGHRHWHQPDCPWYTVHFEIRTFIRRYADTLRRFSIRQQVSALALDGQGARKIKQLLENAFNMAA
jgi:hypothetical protein